MADYVKLLVRFSHLADVFCRMIEMTKRSLQHKMLAAHVLRGLTVNVGELAEARAAASMDHLEHLTEFGSDPRGIMRMALPVVLKRATLDVFNDRDVGSVLCSRRVETIELRRAYTERL